MISGSKFKYEAVMQFSRSSVYPRAGHVTCSISFLATVKDSNKIESVSSHILVHHDELLKHCFCFHSALL